MDYLDKELFEQDLQSIALWLNVENVSQIAITMKSMSIDIFKHHIESMEASYEKFPLEEKRTKKIFSKIKNGAQPQPIFIEKNDPDNFIMEGRHRLVAFKWLGIQEVLIAEVSKNELTLENKPASNHVNKKSKP